MSLIEIALLVVVGVVTWLVSSEGIWGAAQTFLCTLLAGLVAMNFFEPLANAIRGIVGDDYADVVALLGLFTALVFALRMGTEHLAPSYIQVIPILDTVGKWGFGAITGYLTVAIFLTALHTAPLPREFLGFKPERDNFFGNAPDRQWLGFVQYVSEKPLARAIFKDKIGNQDIVVVHAFDGRYEKIGDPARPYPNRIWSSFPIRYAQRRERIGNHLAGSTPAPPVQQITPPTGPGGVSNPGF
ncbi:MULTISPECIES: CvpA family protein [unclassified Schlesneria]|uniref:CvpA family protein n=1 Tax=Schlesneria TaxID=656899 RepID=UPI002F227771